MAKHKYAQYKAIKLYMRVLVCFVVVNEQQPFVQMRIVQVNSLIAQEML